jgi:hypothetical protein
LAEGKKWDMPVANAFLQIFLSAAFGTNIKKLHHFPENGERGNKKLFCFIFFSVVDPSG